MNLLAAEVSPLTLFREKTRADSHRPLPGSQSQCAHKKMVEASHEPKKGGGQLLLLNLAEQGAPRRRYSVLDRLRVFMFPWAAAQSK
jgi:hypothetical protein